MGKTKGGSVSASALRCAVIGARRQRQGTGEWVARELQKAGARVSAIVGTSEPTIRTAREGLADRYGIHCNGYGSLEALLDAEEIDAVAICSPAEVHEEQLEQAAVAGCHVLCEKPLWWAADEFKGGLGALEVEQRTTALVQRFQERGRYLAINTQWPFTLEAFGRLHPDATSDAVHSFEMWLGPSRPGADGVLDSGSHLVSMLEAVTGPGQIDNLRIGFDDSARTQMSLELTWRWAGGDTEVSFRLTHCPQPPRLAGYAINGQRAERQVELPDYTQWFTSEQRRVSVEDPLAASVKSFVAGVQQNRRPDIASLTLGMTCLAKFVKAARQLEEA